MMTGNGIPISHMSNAPMIISFRVLRGSHTHLWLNYAKDKRMIIKHFFRHFINLLTIMYLNSSFSMIKRFLLSQYSPLTYRYAD